jgi:hypothetical protein
VVRDFRFGLDAKGQLTKYGGVVDRVVEGNMNLVIP